MGSSKFESLLAEGKKIGLANIQPAMDSITLTERDLQDMVLTAGYKGSKPYIAKGHDGVYEGGREPSYGYLYPNSLRVENGILYATPEYVNPELIREIEEGKYSKLSIEFGWVNYNDVPVFDNEGNELDLISALIRWIYMDSYLYDASGDVIEPRDVFKYHLRGVAVLGRTTPAYPQFDVSKKRNIKDINKKDFKNCFTVRTVDQIYIDKKNKKKEVISKMESTKNKSKNTETKTNEIIKDRRNVEEVKEKEENKTEAKINTENKTETSTVENENLRDAYDTQLDKLKREIAELKQELELSKTQKQTVLEEKAEMNTQVKNLKHELNKEKVYNLWLTYRQDGRLRREDMISPEFEMEKAMATVRQINDTAEREIAKREVSKDAICSGKFFEDFNVATKGIQEMMIRNIERKPALMEEGQQTYGRKQMETQKDYTTEQGTEDYSKVLYRKSRELAKQKGIDVNSEKFDIEYWRREAIRKLKKENELGGYYA